MSSSWPILLGVFAVVVAAFWYDATIAAGGGSPALVPVRVKESRALDPHELAGGIGPDQRSVIADRAVGDEDNR